MLKKKIIIGAYIFLFSLMCVLLIVFTLKSGTSDIVKTSLWLFVGLILSATGAYKFVERAKKVRDSDEGEGKDDGQL